MRLLTGSICLLLLFFIGCKEREVQKELPKPHNYQAEFNLRIGDILFQDQDCGPFCNAIEKVTQGIHGADFSHNGIISSISKNEVLVLEAIGRGVVETPLDSFLLRSQDQKLRPKTLVGRLRDTFSRFAPIAVEYAKDHLGAEYDSHFDILNDRYYCSELLYEAFKKANNGAAMFKLRPMTFNDPDTNLPFPQWVSYFKDLKSAIPEGMLGLNPGSMSRSFYIEIVHEYGKPTGYRNRNSHLEE